MALCIYIYTPTYLHTCILATFSTTYSTYLLIDYILLLIECCYKYIQIHRHNRHVLHTLPAPTTYFCSYFTSSVIQFFLEHHYPRHHVTRIGCLGAPGTYNNKNNKNRTTNGNNNKTYIYIYIWLVVLPILKNDGVKVNGKDDIPYMKWKINKCLQPPTRYINIYIVYILHMQNII